MLLEDGTLVGGGGSSERGGGGGKKWAWARCRADIK